MSGKGTINYEFVDAKGSWLFQVVAVWRNLALSHSFELYERPVMKPISMCAYT